MFAVKGWAVDANALKPQTTPFKTAAAATSSSAVELNAPQRNRKRKRGGEGGGGGGGGGGGVDNANEEDVGKLWDRVVEKKGVGRKGKDKKKVKVDGKQDGKGFEGLGEDQVSEGKVADGDGKGAKKKRKKGEEKVADGNDEVVPAKKKTENQVADGNDKVPTKKKAEKKKATDRQPPSDQAAALNATKNQPASTTTTALAKLTPMQAAMRQKLISARFRHLNQTLYTETSTAALDLFTQNPEMFEDYHSGFRQQVSVWPENPIDSFIEVLRSRGGLRLPSQKKAMRERKRKSTDTSEGNTVADARVPPLPRTQGTCIIADLGCGDARLAQTLKASGDGTKLNLRIHSYDLHSPSPLVTKADISNLPLSDGAADVAIFCLALMGTNWIAFVEEAYRILHWKGELWVAEIKSRFGRIPKAGARKPVEHSVGGKRKQAALKKAQDAQAREAEEVNEQQALQVEVDGVETKDSAETDVSAFVEVLQRRGFVLKNGDSSIDLTNKMFVKMEFVKAATPSKGKGAPAVDAQSRPAAPGKFKPKMKFLDDASSTEPTTDDEAKVLKPCLYKIR